MAASRRTATTAGESARKLSHDGDVTHAEPMVDTKTGEPGNEPIVAEEDKRLTGRNRQVFRAKDTPEYFVAALEAIAREETDDR